MHVTQVKKKKGSCLYIVSNLCSNITEIVKKYHMCCTICICPATTFGTKFRGLKLIFLNISNSRQRRHYVCLIKFVCLNLSHKNTVINMKPHLKDEREREPWNYLQYEVYCQKKSTTCCTTLHLSRDYFCERNDINFFFVRKKRDWQKKVIF